MNRQKLCLVFPRNKMNNFNFCRKMNESSWEHDGSFVFSAFQPRPSIYFIVCLAPDIRLMARLKACDRSPAACRMKRSNGQ